MKGKREREREKRKMLTGGSLRSEEGVFYRLIGATTGGLLNEFPNVGYFINF